MNTYLPVVLVKRHLDKALYVLRRMNLARQQASGKDKITKQRDKTRPFQSSLVQSGLVQSSLVWSGLVQSSLVSVWSSLVQSSLVQSSLVQSSLVQSSLVQSSLVQSSLVQSSLVQSSLVQSSLVQSSPVQSSLVQSSLVQSCRNLVQPSPASPCLALLRLVQSCFVLRCVLSCLVLSCLVVVPGLSCGCLCPCLVLHSLVSVFVCVIPLSLAPARSKTLQRHNLPFSQPHSPFWCCTTHTHTHTHRHRHRHRQTERQQQGQQNPIIQCRQTGRQDRQADRQQQGKKKIPSFDAKRDQYEKISMRQIEIEGTPTHTHTRPTKNSTVFFRKRSNEISGKKGADGKNDKEKPMIRKKRSQWKRRYNEPMQNQKKGANGKDDTKGPSCLEWLFYQRSSPRVRCHFKEGGDQS